MSTSLVFGADAPATTASGSTAIPEQKDAKTLRIERDRAKRADGFVIFQLQNKAGSKAYQAALDTYYSERLDLRKQCREDLRRSNRDTELPTTLRCYRGELTLDRQLMVEEKKYFDGIPSLAINIKQQLTTPVDSLLDALNGFINAIDKNVFQSEDEIREARKNLYQNYRIAALDAVAMAQADRLLYWTASLLPQVTDVQRQQNIIAGQPIPAWDSSISCLTNADLALRSVLDDSTTDKRGAYRQAITDLQTCTDAMATTPEASPPSVTTGSGSTQTGSSK